MSQASHVLQETQAVAPQADAKRAEVRPMPLVPARADMHPSVFRVAFVCWLALLSVFWVTFFVSSSALFMVVVSTFYAVVFFGVPYTFWRINPKRASPRQGLHEFLRTPFETMYGVVSGREALLQVIMVPLAVTLGGIAMGIAIHAARAAY
jgi:hypothetical protein